MNVEIFSSARILPDPIPKVMEMPFPDEKKYYLYQCLEKIGRNFFPANKLRRLGRTQKMALVIAHQCLEKINLEVIPEDLRAICIGSALGETGQTAIFLEKMIQYNEPKPAKFINSVHNSIASHLGITYQFKGENHTISHSSISFELALWQSMILLKNHRAKIAFACGVDEAISYLLLAGSKQNWYQKEGSPLLPMKNSKHGTLLGEGGGGFLLATKESFPSLKSLATLVAVKARPLDSILVNVDQEVQFIEETLLEKDYFLDDLDLILLGANGNAKQDKIYHGILEKLAQKSSKKIFYGTYKHLCGEFCTASSIGFTLAVEALEKGKVIPKIKIIQEGSALKIQKILIYQFSFRGSHSVALLKSS